MQDRRISFADLWLGLALDKEYGPGCEELLNKTLARHDLTTKNFPGPVNSLGCHNNLVRIWLGYEELPFYYCGKEQPVRFDLDNITPRTFLEENELPEIEVRRLDLACFLRERALPLPAPDVKDKTIWFHGEYASTEDNDSSFDPVLAEAVFKLNSLERDKRDCGIKAPQTITERKIQEGEIESIDAALSLLKRVLDAGSSITEEAKRYSRNRAHLAVLCLILPEGWSRDVENYQNDLHPSLSAVAQDAAYEWCRYYDIKKELKKLEDEGQPGEWLQRRIRLLKKEKNAISLWMEDERDTSTTGDPEILEDYPSPFAKNCTSPTDSRGKKGNSKIDADSSCKSQGQTKKHISAQDNYFILEGEFWKVKFNGGEEASLKKSVTIETLALFLKHRGEEIPWDKVDAFDSLSSSAIKTIADRTELETSSTTNNRGKTLNVNARLTPEIKENMESIYLDLTSKLEKTLMRGETDKAKEFEGKIEQLRISVRKHYNATLRDNGTISWGKCTDATEYSKQAKKIQKRLSRAVDKIEEIERRKKSLQGLSEHVQKFLIKNGNRYNPPKSFPGWSIVL